MGDCAGVDGDAGAVAGAGYFGGSAGFEPVWGSGWTPTPGSGCPNGFVAASGVFEGCVTGLVGAAALEEPAPADGVTVPGGVDKGVVAVGLCILGGVTAELGGTGSGCPIGLISG